MISISHGSNAAPSLLRLFRCLLCRLFCWLVEDEEEEGISSSRSEKDTLSLSTVLEENMVVILLFRFGFGIRCCC